MHPEEQVWQDVNPNDMWVLDKLILSRKLGYRCGPTGTPVPYPDHYIVRPCINPCGLGLGAQILFIDYSTDDLPPGHFWCEIFKGRHLSVDYHKGLQVLCVEGFKHEDTLTRWDRWERVSDYVTRPKLLLPIMKKYEWVNCEFIGGKLIEAHLRKNVDFPEGRQEYIPVWDGMNEMPPKGYEYIEDPELHGRIGAWVK